MARPLRIEYENALYHIISRGNEGMTLFIQDQDRHAFMNVLERVVERYNWICHAYCLMG
ncbi:MAG: addiction module toxin RelE, partial [Deltaproteobacteria bacterium]|nr:addiction module toxin RelE [Deltaproteobacteria bacterium]NIS76152.1 addiction module toxin RelE [Deltaproteobacteria bacterium]